MKLDSNPAATGYRKDEKLPKRQANMAQSLSHHYPSRHLLQRLSLHFCPSYPRPHGHRLSMPPRNLPRASASDARATINPQIPRISADPVLARGPRLAGDNWAGPRLPDPTSRQPAGNMVPLLEAREPQRQVLICQQRLSCSLSSAKLGDTGGFAG